MLVRNHSAYAYHVTHGEWSTPTFIQIWYTSICMTDLNALTLAWKSIGHRDHFNEASSADPFSNTRFCLEPCHSHEISSSLRSENIKGSLYLWSICCQLRFNILQSDHFQANEVDYVPLANSVLRINVEMRYFTNIWAQKFCVDSLICGQEGGTYLFSWWSARHADLNHETGFE